MADTLAETVHTLPEGYTMRPTTLDDIEPVAQLYMDVALANGVPYIEQPDEMRVQWTEPDFDLGTASRVVHDRDGKLVAIVTVYDNFSSPVNPQLGWEVRHGADYMALVQALLAWGEERAKQVFDKCPPEARITFQTGTISTDKRAIEALDTAGLKPTRYFNHMRIDMTAEPDAAALPEGITVRTYQHPNDLPKLMEAQDEAWRDHFGYMERPLEERQKNWERWITTEKKWDATLWRLAIDDATGDIIALVLGSIEDSGHPELSHINLVATRRPWRGKGIASALLRESFRDLWQRDRKSIGLYVDDSSPTGANRLYEALGMFIERQYIRYEKELRPGVELTNQG